jgi:cysteine synthase
MIKFVLKIGFASSVLIAIYHLSKARKKSIKKGLTDLIGNTPLCRINSLSEFSGCEILAKVEFMNVAGSPKDRVALSIIESAEKNGKIKPFTGCTIFEGTVGSTGISLATIAKSRGYDCHIIMPDDVAKEKSDLLIKLGATVERVSPCSIIDPNHFVNIARKKAEEMNKLANDTNSGKFGYFCDQFETSANVNAHYKTTGPEIYKQTGGELDAVVMGAGTGGTISGISLYLKQRLPNLRVVLADPQGSGLLNKVKYGVMFNIADAEGSRRRHQIDTIVEGIGLKRLTKNFDIALKSKIIDDAIHVTDQEAVDMSRYIMKNDGFFIGSSSAVNCVAAVRLAKILGPGHTIVTILCDSGDRHLTKFWNDEFLQKRGLLPKATELEFI